MYNKISYHCECREKHTQRKHMTTTQDYLTHKAAFILGLEARQRTLKFGTSRWMELSESISHEFSRWDMTAKGKVIKKMSDLKTAHPSFDWERDWTKAQEV